MRRAGLIAVVALLGSGLAYGQQAKAPKPSPTKTALSKTARAAKKVGAQEKVKVYTPGSGVKKPRLLPMDPELAITRKCRDDQDGETDLSVLVDTEGKARNIMFLRPDGSPVDFFAVTIAEMDRFQPATLKGKPVVVAEILRMKLTTCVADVKNPQGEMVTELVLRSQPRQSLKKPKNPPQEAILAPMDDDGSTIARKVTRPDFFGSDLSAPVMLYSVNAEYTPLQKEHPIRGVCQISLIVDAHGLPRDLHVLKPLDPGLDESALQAVNRYRFFPAIKDNMEPVPAAIVVDVNFAPPGVGTRYNAW